MVKWISRRSSEPLLGVRIPLGAQLWLCTQAEQLLVLCEGFERLSVIGFANRKAPATVVEKLPQVKGYTAPVGIEIPSVYILYFVSYVTHRTILPFRIQYYTHTLTLCALYTSLIHIKNP